MCILKNAKSQNWATEIFHFTNKLKFTLKNGCTNKIYKTLHISFVVVYCHLVLTSKIKRDLQPVMLD